MTMTNKEICTKAVAAYHMANPDITVDEWECDPEQEGVAILSIGGRKVYIKHNEAAGFEMLKHYEAPKRQPKPQVVMGNVKGYKPVPEFIAWKHLADGDTGVLPNALDILALLALVLCVFVGLFFMPLLIVVGIASAISLHVVAAVIRSLRATQAHAAYIEALLAHIADKQE